MLLHHISIICSSEKSLIFYESLGFKEQKRTDRGYDIIVWMEGNSTKLEIFIDPTHPAHVTNPEAYGLRHIALCTENIEKECDRLKSLGYEPEPIRITPDRKKMTFVKDPDGLPIELREI